MTELSTLRSIVGGMTLPKDSARKCRACGAHVHARRAVPDLCRQCTIDEAALRLGLPAEALANYEWCWGCGAAIGVYEKHQRNPRCRACRNARSREFRRSGKSRTPARRYELKLRNKFGISLADYHERLKAQGGGCAICGSKEPGGRLNLTVGTDGKAKFAVDHDHVFNHVRGLLCSGCNLGLGHFKDSPELLRKAIAYLARNQPKLLEVAT